MELAGERSIGVSESREVPPSVDELPVDMASASSTKPFDAPVDVGGYLESKVGILGVGRCVVEEIVKGCCGYMIADEHGLEIGFDDVVLVGLREDFGQRPAIELLEIILGGETSRG